MMTVVSSYSYLLLLYDVRGAYPVSSDTLFYFGSLFMALIMR